MNRKASAQIEIPTYGKSKWIVKATFPTKDAAEVAASQLPVGQPRRVDPLGRKFALSVGPVPAAVAA